jgi:hypothetical protein
MILGSPAMFMRTVVLVGLLFASSSVARAEQPGPTIDLDALARRPASKLTLLAAPFAASETTCPEERAILQFAAGSLIQHRIVSTPENADWRIAVRPVDDNTYVFSMATPDCVIGMTVRQQVLREGLGPRFRCLGKRRPPRRHRDEVSTRTLLTLGSEGLGGIRIERTHLHSTIHPRPA